MTVGSDENGRFCPSDVKKKFIVCPAGTKLNAYIFFYFFSFPVNRVGGIIPNILHILFRFHWIFVGKKKERERDVGLT